MKNKKWATQSIGENDDFPTVDKSWFSQISDLCVL